MAQNSLRSPLRMANEVDSVQHRDWDPIWNGLVSVEPISSRLHSIVV